MTSRTDHRTRLHSAADRLRERLKKDWGFDEPLAIIESYIEFTQEIVMDLLITLTAAKTASENDATTIATLQKTQITPEIQAAGDALAAEPSVAAAIIAAANGSSGTPAA